VEDYYRETKLRRIHVVEDATVKLIGDSRVRSGHVDSIAYGMSIKPKHGQRTVDLRQSDTGQRARRNG
jgi:multidrug resistance efflux pump